MATEAQVSSAIVKGLQLCGHFAFKSSDKYTAGVADILGVYSHLPGLLDASVGRSLSGAPSMYTGRTIAIETKLVKAWPKRPTSKVLQHELSRPQVKFLEAVSGRGGLSYVALAGPGPRPGVEVTLIPFDAWEAGSESLDRKNVTLEWLQSKQRVAFGKMRGNLSKGFLAAAGPLEATFA